MVPGGEGLRGKVRLDAFEDRHGRQQLRGGVVRTHLRKQIELQVRLDRFPQGLTPAAREAVQGPGRGQRVPLARTHGGAADEIGNGAEGLFGAGLEDRGDAGGPQPGNGAQADAERRLALDGGAVGGAHDADRADRHAVTPGVLHQCGG